MSDAVEKYVWNSIIDNWTRSAYLHNIIADVGPAIKKGDTLDIPQQVTATKRSATNRAAPESVTPTVSALVVDKEEFYNMSIPALSEQQILAGNWVAQTANHGVTWLKNSIDNEIATYIAQTLCYTSTATYHVNVASDSLTDDDMAAAEAAILSADGVMRQNLAWVMHPYGMGSAKAIADYVPSGVGSEKGVLGIPMVTHINGIPVYVTNAVPRRRTVATTAVSISSNVATATVASGHGVVPGMKITTSGLTNNATTAVAVTSVTATTVVYPQTASDGAMADGVGTITIECCENMLIDTSRMFFAMQVSPTVRMVPDPESAITALQIYGAYGRIGIAGGAYVVCSPGASI